MADLKALKKKVDVVAIIGSRVELKPQGGAYMACCPFHNESDPSFKLDDRQGEWLWKCFGCGVGGDVIEFIEKFDHCSTADAIQKLEAIAGGKQSDVADGARSRKNKEWRDGAEMVQENFQELGNEVKKQKTVLPLSAFDQKIKDLGTNLAARAWLKDVRGLNDEVIDRMKLGFVQSHVYKFKHDKKDEDSKWEHIRGKGWICFPRIEGNKILAVKLRSIVEKSFSQVNNMDGRALFNIETVTPIEPVYVTEGELDACILEMLGFRAVSVPSAGVEMSTGDRIKLKLAERIFLAGDNDGGVGSEYMKKLARELGENTHWLIWPDGAKDANDFFRDVAGKDHDKARELMAELSKEAMNRPPDGFIGLIKALRTSKGTDLENDPNRMRLPAQMPYADKMSYTTRGGICLLYSTYSGTGKSMLKSDILLNEAKRGEVVVDLSPEIRDQEYLALVTSQTVGPKIGGLKRTGKMDEKYFNQAADILDKPTKKGTDFRYYVGHNVVGTTEDEVLEFLESTIRTLGATRFAIDTFHRLVFAEGKNQAQAEGQLAKKIEGLGRKYGTIFIFICQSNAEAEGIDNLKKNEHGVLRGSRELRDVADTIYLLHRNRRPQKDGENPQGILELETGLYLKKTRYSGTSYPQTRLLLQEENSLFVELANSGGDPGPQSAPPPPQQGEDHYFEQSPNEVY
jgi:hypothetical protein